MNAAPLGVELAKSGEAAKSGPLGLLVILLLCIAAYFLFKSMSRHMRRVREDFPEDAAPPGTSKPVRPQRPVPPARPSRAALRARAAAPAPQRPGEQPVQQPVQRPDGTP